MNAAGVSPRHERSVTAALAGATAFLFALLAREALTGDALAFIAGAGRPAAIDVAHPLWPFVLRGTIAAGAALGAGPERSALTFTAVCVGILTGAVFRLARRLGARSGAAAAGALIVVTSPFFREAATTVEVHAPAAAAGALAVLFAERFRESRRLGDRAAAHVLLLTSAGFHIASLLGLIPILWAMRSGGTRRRAAALDLAFVLITALGLFAAGFCPRHLGDLARAASFFIESRNPGNGFAFGGHIRNALAILREGFPLGAALAAAGAVAAIRRRDRIAALGGIWIAPFLAAYLMLGIPIAGLWWPAAGAFALFIAALGKRRATSIALVITTIIHIAFLYPAARREAIRPSDLPPFAAAIVSGAPPNTVFIVDGMKPALDRFTAARSIGITAEFRRFTGSGGRREDFVAHLHGIAVENRKRGLWTAIDEDAARVLVGLVGAPVSPDALVDGAQTLVVRESPRYALHLMRGD